MFNNNVININAPKVIKEMCIMARKPLSLERQQDAVRLKSAWESFKEDARGKGRKVTQEDVSEACGWNTQGAFSAYLNGRTPLNLDALIKLSNYFGKNPSEISPDLAAGIESVSITSGDSLEDYEHEVKPTGRWVPVKSYSKMGMDGYFSDMGYDGNAGDGFVPTLTAGQYAYAVKGTGDSMYPVVRSGWFLVCDPDAEPQVTEFVEVQLRDGRRTIKEFIGIIGNVLHVLAVNGNERITFDMSEVERIVPVVEIIPPSRHRHEIPVIQYKKN